MSTLPTAMIETTQWSLGFATEKIILESVFHFVLAAIAFRALFVAYSEFSTSAQYRVWGLIQLAIAGFLFYGLQYMDLQNDPMHMKERGMHVLLMFTGTAGLIRVLSPSSLMMGSKNLYEHESHYVSHQISLLFYKIASYFLVAIASAMYLLSEVHSWYPANTSIEFVLLYLRFASMAVLVPFWYFALDIAVDFKKRTPTLTKQTSSNS